MSTTRIAAQLYTLRDFLKTPEEIAATLKRVAAIGYRAVQLSGLGPIETTELKRILDGEGLAVCANHTYWAQLRDEPQKVLDEHAALECGFTALPIAPVDMRTGEGYATLAREASVAAQWFTERGLRIGYHNHSFEFEKFDGRTGLEILYTESDPRWFMAELDTYWVQHGGGDPVAWIRKLKGRLPFIHFKDMVVVENQPVMAEVGEGNLNWPAILEACVKAGVEWYIIEQDTCRRDPFESLAISLRNVNTWGIH